MALDRLFRVSFWLHLVKCLPVMIQQHVDYVLEELRLLGVEVPTLDLVNHLSQLRDAVIVLLSVVPAQKHEGELSHYKLLLHLMSIRSQRQPVCPVASQRLD